MDDELIPEFIEESKASLSSIESDLLLLESNMTLDKDCVNRVFRAIHTIKGGGSFLKLDTIVSVSHRAESLLSKIRDGEANTSSENVGVILDAVDALVEMLDLPDLGATHDYSAILSRLDAIVKGEGSPEKKPGDLSSAPVVAIASNEPVGVLSQRKSESPPASEEKKSVATTRISDPTMRVPASVLNHLLQITGGMVMARNQLLNGRENLIDPTLDRLSRLISEVHETVIKTRKSTTGVLFMKFQRVVRDLSLSLGKEINLVIEGGDLELDRAIIDSFSDPLTHLVRNCVDHAIETPEVRLQVGKERCGTIWLRSFQQSGEIVLEVEDDGKGINPIFIRKKAIEKGLINPQQAADMSDQEAIHLIFAPGFSTKEQATDVSGRGVGMDVVKTNIEQIGGSITFDSKTGLGTKLTAHLPLAKALVASSLTKTLIVTVGESQFAIPDSAVCEIIRPDKSNYPRDFRALEHGEVFHLRETILPLIHLADAIDKPRMLYSPRLGKYLLDPFRTIGQSTIQSDSKSNIRPAPPNVSIVIIRHRQHRFALVVNEVLGMREAIVQPVPKLIEHCWMYTGHAVMGDGRCIFILDVGGIANRNKLNFDSTGADNVPAIRKSKKGAAERVLVFNYAEDEYFAIPLEIAALVQTVQPDKLRRVGTTSYYPTQDKMAKILFLDHYLKVRPLKNPNDPQTIILPANFDIDVALACGTDIRVHELSGCFRSKSEDDLCSVGLFELEGRLVTLLDLYKLVEMHSPDQLTLNTVVPVKAARILCAEDSVFFQRLLCQYLQRPEWEFTITSNGREAWDLLDKSPDYFNLLISDINMPEMNGFELGERVRADGRFKDLPMIALTTQVDEASRVRGLEIGFEKYVGKINKFELRKCVESVLQASSFSPSR